MTTLKQIQSVNTLSELNNLGLGNVIYDIGGRGGNMGFYSSAVARCFNINPEMLPEHFGAYCNYLGGGVRGAVATSTFDSKISKGKAKLLSELAEACKRAYLDLENENNMNDELDADDEINWDAMVTRAHREAGIVSAY